MHQVLPRVAKLGERLAVGVGGEMHVSGIDDRHQGVGLRVEIAGAFELGQQRPDVCAN
ncbi:Uncharacterised protein [Mycobacteroides abscessus subsp. massiliense]|nr:Uncharacterised protein [Mycobacteroides abscessus subsp. massiliense]